MSLRAAAALLVACAARAAAAPPPEALARAEAFFRREVPRAGFPGASLTIVSEGRIVLSTSVGVADLERQTPVRPATLYNIASMTKAITASALLQLRDRGLVDLDAPVVRYLPWFRVADGEAASRAITLRQLLHHTSGLPVNSHAVVWQDEESIRGSLERGVRALAGVKLSHPPGAAFEYANMNYAVLGLIVEVVSGERFVDYVDKHLFRPLGMTSTSADPRRVDAARLATPYGPWFGGLGPMPLTVGEFTAPASAVVSNTDDMARWAAAQLGHGPPGVLSPAALDEAHRPGPEMPPFGRYACGWIARDLGGVTVLQHGGASGHSGTIYLVPERDLALVLLVGAFSTDRPLQIADGITSILIGREPAPIGGFGELERLMWVDRALMVGAVASIGLLAWLGVRVFRRRRRESVRRALSIAVATSLIAAFLWCLAFAIVPALVPELPIPFGFRGWPTDVAITLATILPCSYLWASFSLVGVVRALRRRDGDFADKRH